jgi:hypothetical protein
MRSFDLTKTLKTRRFLDLGPLLKVYWTSAKIAREKGNIPGFLAYWLRPKFLFLGVVRTISRGLGWGYLKVIFENIRLFCFEKS